MKEAKEEIHLLLSNDPTIQPGYYDEHYTNKERRQLSRALNQTLWEEVALFRMCIKKFFALTASKGVYTDLDGLRSALDTLGLSCTRLARIMQVNQSLGGERSSLRVFNDVLGKMLDEWEAEDLPDGS